jgi:hypothetical protein
VWASDLGLARCGGLEGDRLRIPMPEWLVWVVQHSTHAIMAAASSSPGLLFFVSSSSSCIVPQNGSIMALR